MVLENIKIKKGLSISERDSIPFIQAFVEEMMEAATKDDEELAFGRPALHKLHLLPKVVAVCRKYVFADIFVSYDGCRALATWLKPLPSGELPAIHLRRILLQIMTRLPITKDALLNCSLGSVVKTLHQSPQETVANKQMAGALVQRWLKQILLKKIDDIDVDAEEEKRQPTIPAAAVETLESFQALEQESFSRDHPRIPQRGEREYVVQPAPQHEAVKRAKEKVDTNRFKLGESLKVLTKPNKKGWKPYAVSIAGRQVNAI